MGIIGVPLTLRTRRADARAVTHERVTRGQRFGSQANLNTHAHCLVVNGTYSSDGDVLTRFAAVDAPTGGDELGACHDADESLLMRC